MTKDLKWRVNDYIKSLKLEIYDLEVDFSIQAEARKITLEEVVDWLETIIYAEEFREFEENNKKL